MSAATTALPGRPPPLELARQWWWRHPELPVLAAGAIAALALAGAHLADHSARMHASWSFDPFHWALMVVAMMVPGTAPMARRIALDSLWRRRHRNVALFVGTYTAVWMAAGSLAAAVVALGRSVTGDRFDPGRWWVVAALAVAAAWQAAPQRRRSLRRCHLRVAVAPSGWRATRDLLRYGLLNGVACVGACWAMMAAMFVAGDAVHLMLPLGAVSLAERFRPRSHPALAIGGLVVAMLVAVAS